MGDLLTLAARPDVLCIGQGVMAGGTRMKFDSIPAEARIEFPVAEELQLGFCIGLSLEGFLPVCCYPRMDFLLRAMDQLVNHLDRLPLYSGYRPKVIVRTALGSNRPLDPGPQHQGDYTEAIRLMLRTVHVERLQEDSYQRAAERDGSTVIVE